MEAVDLAYKLVRCMVDMNRAQQGVQFSTSFLWKHWKTELDEQQQNNDCEVILRNAKSVKAKHKKQRSNKVSKENPKQNLQMKTNLPARNL